MMSKDFLRSVNYTIIDGPLKRNYESKLESTSSYTYYHRLIIKVSNNNTCIFPTIVNEIIATNDQTSRLYKRFYRAEPSKCPHAPILRALLKRHLIATALKEHILLKCMKEENHKERVKNDTCLDPFYTSKYDFYPDRKTDQLIAPLRYLTPLKDEWLHKLKTFHFNNEILFTFGMRISSMADFANSYGDMLYNTKNLRTYIYDCYGLDMPLRQMAKVIDIYKDNLYQEGIRINKLINQYNRRRDSKIVHVLHYHENGLVSYNNMPKHVKSEGKFPYKDFIYESQVKPDPSISLDLNAQPIQSEPPKRKSEKKKDENALPDASELLTPEYLDLDKPELDIKISISKTHHKKKAPKKPEKVPEPSELLTPEYI